VLRREIHGLTGFLGERNLATPTILTVIVHAVSVGTIFLHHDMLLTDLAASAFDPVRTRIFHIAGWREASSLTPTTGEMMASRRSIRLDNRTISAHFAGSYLRHTGDTTLGRQIILFKSVESHSAGQGRWLDVRSRPDCGTSNARARHTGDSGYQSTANSRP
jgi:hypothetical protein